MRNEPYNAPFIWCLVYKSGHILINYNKNNLDLISIYDKILKFPKNMIIEVTCDILTENLNDHTTPRQLW